MFLFLFTCTWIYLGIPIQTLGNNNLFLIHMDFYLTIAAYYSTETITLTNYIWEMCKKTFFTGFLYSCALWIGSLLNRRLIYIFKKVFCLGGGGSFKCEEYQILDYLLLLVHIISSIICNFFHQLSLCSNFASYPSIYLSFYLSIFPPS